MAKKGRIRGLGIQNPDAIIIIFGILLGYVFLSYKAESYTPVPLTWGQKIINLLDRLFLRKPRYKIQYEKTEGYTQVPDPFVEDFHYISNPKVV